jgi:hypothetical protein
MRRPPHHAVTLLVLSLFTVSTIASAQRGGGGRGRQQQQNNYPESIGIAGPPVLPPTVASIVLDHATDIGIVDSQRVAIEAIRRMQDSANKPWLMKLDSLRPTSQPAGGSKDLSPEQRDTITARKKAITDVLDGMHDTNAYAREKVMNLLTPPQQEKAAKYEDDARNKAEDETKSKAQRVMNGANGGSGRQRPPED